MKEKYTKIVATSNLDEASETRAIQMFYSYKEQGILDGNFGGNYWKINNEVIIAGIYFDIDDVPESLNLGNDEIIKYLKIYFVFRIGELQVATLLSVINKIKEIIRNPDALDYITDDMKIGFRILEFFGMLPVRPSFYNRLEDKISNLKFEKGKQRQLCSLWSYFRFSDILERFEKDGTEEQKLFYFPIWFWWNFTAIIPTRPTEFIITPKNCLTEKNGKYYVVLRKSKLKGNSKHIGYRIETDYVGNTYEIPEKLASKIKWYQNKTSDFNSNEIDTLFSVNVYFDYIGVPRTYRSRYFTYPNMYSCLRLFYEEIIHDLYGYEVLYDDTKWFIGSNQIQFIHLGDTRHISLANIMLEGGNPIIAMTMAGHDNMEMFEHYASNVDKIMQCVAQRTYLQITNAGKEFEVSRYHGPLNIKDYTLVDGGRCYSSKFKEGNFEDCKNCLNEDGQIGKCQDCTFFRCNDTTFHKSKELYLDKLRRQLELIKVLYKKLNTNERDPDELIRLAMAYEEEAYSYQQYLIETKDFGGEEKDG